MPLILSNRPKEKDLLSIKTKVDGILTILAENEAGSLVSAIRYNGIKSWHHKYTIKKSSMVSDAEWFVYRLDLDEIAELVSDGKTILVHCSAGIHRTGCNAYAIFRRLGYDRKQAYHAVIALREESKDCERFLDWAEATLV